MSYDNAARREIRYTLEGRDESPTDRARKQCETSFSTECSLFATEHSLLKTLEAPPYWSGSGERYDVEVKNVDERRRGQLRGGLLLGSSDAGSNVRKVTYGGIPMAKKSITGFTKKALEGAKAEADVIKKLHSDGGHHHIIQLVGSFWEEAYDNIYTSYILTWPVAVCDLDQHLDDVTWTLSVDDANITAEGAGAISRLEGLGLPPVLRGVSRDYIYESLVRRLQTIMGCLANAVRFLHANNIEHCDLKPSNVLLRHGQLYVTDFGISRDRSKRERTTTQFYPGHTRGYTAPEVLATASGDGMISPKEADIFSLGCIYLHILTVVYLSRSNGPHDDTPSHPLRYAVSLAMSGIGFGTTTASFNRNGQPTAQLPRGRPMSGHSQAITLATTLQVRGLAGKVLKQPQQALNKAVHTHLGRLKRSRDGKAFQEKEKLRRLRLSSTYHKDESFELVADMLLVDRGRRPAIEAVIERLGVFPGRCCRHCVRDTKLRRTKSQVIEHVENELKFIDRVLNYMGISTKA